VRLTRRSFLAPQATAQDIPYAIRSFIDANLASLAHDLNESNAVKLPAEIIAEVLSHLPLEDRFTASLVSPDWNAALKTSPHLWDEAVCDHTRDSAVWMERLLQFSGDTSLNLDITVSAQNQDVVLETLLQVLDRCLSLHVFFNSDYGWPDVDKFINTIAGEAPRLLRFGLHDTVPPHLYHGIGPGVKLFGGLTNNLVRIELECDLVALDDLDATAFANVITAHVSHHGDMTPASLWRLLHVLPVVEALTIQIEGWHGPGDEDDSKPMTPPTSLRSLDLMTEKDTTSLLPMLASLNWRDIFRVGLGIEGHSYTVNQLVSFFSGTPRVTDGSSECTSLQTAWIDWYDESTDLDGGVCVFLTDSNVDPHALILQGWQDRHPSVTTMERSITRLKAQLPAAICANITRLYLHELTFDSVALPVALPEFPAVTHLTIVLANSHFTRNDLGISPFIVSSHKRNAPPACSSHTDRSIRLTTLSVPAYLTTQRIPGLRFGVISSRD